MTELDANEMKSVAGGVTAGPDGRGCTEPPDSPKVPSLPTGPAGQSDAQA